MSMQLILVTPGLLAHPPQALAAAPSLARLAQSAPPPRLERHGIATALVGALGAATGTPVAPLAALGADIDPHGDYLLFADPVFLAADRDDVVLMERVDDLGAEHAAALAATLNRHFADDGVQFELARPDAWFVRCVNAPDVVMTPFDAAYRRGVYPHLPRGADGGTWNRRQNEIQMLLHEHPVNAMRESASRVPVNGVWFWGGGRLADVGALPAAAVTAAGGRASDFARGVARRGGGTTRPLERNDSAQRAVERAMSPASAEALPAVIVVIDGDTAVSAFESQWLEPALALLSRRRIDSLDLVADGNGTAAHWKATPPGLWQRLVAGAQRKPFAVPMPDES